MAFEPAEKKTGRGKRKEGRRGGHAFGGRWCFEGQPRGRSSIIGQDRGRGERRLSQSFQKRVRRTRRRKRDGRERKEEQSTEHCRPGSQIRRGLKSSVDCV